MTLCFLSFRQGHPTPTLRLLNSFSTFNAHLGHNLFQKPTVIAQPNPAFPPLPLSQTKP